MPASVAAVGAHADALVYPGVLQRPLQEEALGVESTLLRDQDKGSICVTGRKSLLERSREALHHRRAEVRLGGGQDSVAADQAGSGVAVVSRFDPGDVFFGARRRRRRVDQLAR